MPIIVSGAAPIASGSSFAPGAGVIPATTGRRDLPSILLETSRSALAYHALPLSDLGERPAYPLQGS